MERVTGNWRDHIFAAVLLAIAGVLNGLCGIAALGTPSCSRMMLNKYSTGFDLGSCFRSLVAVARHDRCTERPGTAPSSDRDDASRPGAGQC
jgi:hypothetical protein